MIFPLDVNKVIINSKKIAGQNKVQAIITTFVLGSLALFYFTDKLLRTFFGTGLLLTIVIDLVIICIVGILVFRFVLFDEDAKRREYEGSESDSFAKYLFIRKDLEIENDLGDYVAPIFEFVNGTTMTIFELRFGSNDNEKAKNTRELYEYVLHEAASSNIVVRYLVGSENFRTSTEFRNHLAALNNIEDKDAARNVKIIDDAIIESSCKECNVDVVYIQLCTNSGFQRYELESLMKRVHNQFKGITHAFRDFHYLSSQEMIEFLREFYGIEAIDLTMMRTMDLVDQDIDMFKNAVTLYQLQSESGRIFTATDTILGSKARSVN